jgi:hypothetical protein
MKKLFLILVLGLFLGGCASTYEDYMHQSEYKLCMNYLTMAGNIHQESRYEAIKRKGYNCNPYREEARKKKIADDEFRERTKEALGAVIDCSVKGC